MNKSVVLCAYALLLLSLLSFAGCGSGASDDTGPKKVRVTSIEPACAEPGSPAGYIEGNGFGALNVTITVGGVEAMVLAATGGEASFIIPEGLPPGPTHVIVTNPGGRIAQIEWVVCGDVCTPTGPEVCDGIDNDCNDLIDDGIEDIVSGSDVGECQAEIQRCVDGALAIAQPGVGPSEEVCDALDNDCSGTADDGIADIVSGNDVGECQEEIQSCVDGTFAIVQPGAGPSGEVCDALDNDCNGTADDGVPDLISGTDVGLCELEVQRCVEGVYALIQPGVGPMPEFCDSFDNNCNGVPDDGIADMIIGTDIGECVPEVQSCLNGAFVITQFEVGPSPESCDALDNDCTGVADDGIVDVVMGTDVGECQLQIENCVNGSFVITQFGVGPSDELCDTLDNDCNGTIDDEPVCEELDELVAIPGMDQQLTLGEKLVLVGSSAGAVGDVGFSWAVRGKPDGSNFDIEDPASPSQLLVPEVAGEYLLELIVSDDARLSEPSTVRVNVHATPPSPPAEIVVEQVYFTEQLDGRVDPRSEVVVTLSGPVDAASLTDQTVRLLLADTLVQPTELTFDPGGGQLRIVPRSPLPAAGFFRLRIENLRATEEPFVFEPFESTFFAVEPMFGRVEGQVVTPTRAPLPEVTVHVAGQTAVTDNAGEFSFQDVPAGQQHLEIDPSSVGGSIAYTPLHYILEVQGGAKTTTVGAPIVLTVVDVVATIDYPSETVLRGSEIGDLTIDFGGAQVYNPDGTPYAGPISVSPVPSNDVPMPFPEPAFDFWTVQPGGLLIDPPAKITVPLAVALPEGLEVELWAFDHGTNDWVGYGSGIVDSGGTTATSIEGGGLPFTGWGAAQVPQTVTRSFGSGTCVAAAASSLEPAEATTTSVVARLDPAAGGRVLDSSGYPLHGVLVEIAGRKAYTDYDCTSSLADGVTGEFLLTDVPVGVNIPCQPGSPELCFTAVPTEIAITAHDLNGTEYSLVEIVDVADIADPTLPDGGLPDRLDLGDFVLNYPVVTADNIILLHRDDRETRAHSHGILKPLTKEQRAIAMSERHQAEIAAVARKLASMGFRDDASPPPNYPEPAFLVAPPSNVVPIDDQSFIDAYSLWHNIWWAEGRTENLTAYAARFRRGTDPPRIVRGRLGAINATNGILWAQWNDPDTGHDLNPNARRNRWFNARPATQLAKIGTKNTLSSLSPANGGKRYDTNCCKTGCYSKPTAKNHYCRVGNTHRSGSEVDFFMRTLNNGRFNGSFYRPLEWTARIAFPAVPAGATAAQKAKWKALRKKWNRKTNTETRIGGRSTRPNADEELVGAADAVAERTAVTTAIAAKVAAITDPDVDPDSIVIPTWMQNDCTYNASNSFRCRHCDPWGPANNCVPATDGYGRTHTANYIDNDLLAVGGANTPVLFNDPVIANARTDVSNNVKKHHDHIHAYFYTFGDVIPRADVAPPPAGPPVFNGLEPELFSVLYTIPADGEESFNGSFPIQIRLNREVDPLTLAENVVFESSREPNVPFSISVDETGTLITVAPSAGLAGFEVYTLGLLPGVKDASGNPLSLEDGLSYVVFGTDLSTEIETVSLTPSAVFIRPDNLGEALVSVNAGTSGGDSVALTEFVSAYFQDRTDGKRRTAQIDSSGQFLSVLEGNTELSAHPGRGLIAVGLLDVDLLPNVKQLGIARTGESLRVQLSEAIAVGVALPSEGRVLQASALASTATVVVSGTGLELEVVPAEELPAFERLTLELKFQVEDEQGNAIEVVELLEFRVYSAPSAGNDTDGDGLSDDIEDLLDCVDASIADTDGDGVLDGEEDCDLDGLSNLLEFQLGTDPSNLDSDGDGSSDGDEVAEGCNPLGSDATSVAGRVVGTDGQPVEGVVVTIGLETAVTGPDGSFELSARGCGDNISARAYLGVGGLALSGTSSDVPPVVGGTTDLGDIVVQERPRFVWPAYGLDGSPSLANNGPQSVSGDFNGDANVDVLWWVPSFQSAQVFLGRGDGTFETQSPIPLAGQLPGVAAADVDADGATDLVTANSTELALSLSNGDGTFAPPLLFPANFPANLTAGDFDGDGYGDVAFSGRSPEHVSVLYGDGLGSLLSAIDVAMPVVVDGIAIGRVDVNSIPDIVVRSKDYFTIPPYPLAVAKANGPRSFSEAIASSSSPPAGGGAQSRPPQIGRFNADSFADVLSPNSLALGNGDGTFQTAQTIDTSDEFPVAADFDGDGNLDYAVVSGNFGLPTEVFVSYGLGDGTFRDGPELRFRTPFAPVSLTAADVDGDGRPDLVSESGVLLQGSSGFVPIRVLKAGSGAARDEGDVADVNSDGVVDILNCTGTQLEVLYGVGDGSFEEPVTLSVSTSPVDVAGADLDGDGNIDIISSHRSPALVSVLLSNGDGTFAGPDTYPLAGGESRMVVYDLDGDDFLDVAVASGGSVAVLLGNGDGTLGTPQSFPEGGWVFDIAAGDVNGDDIVDIVTPFNGLSVHLGVGDGTFGPGASYNPGTQPKRVSLADVDNDGDLDAMALKIGTGGDMAVSLGNGDGTFVPGNRYTAAVNTYSMNVFDADGDGNADIVFGGSTTAVLMGNGDGTFRPRAFIPCEIDQSIEVGDVNGDTSLDMICRNNNGITVIPQR